MPYYFDYQIEMSDSIECWEMLEEIWYIIDTDLTGVSFETREEAISQRYRKSLDPDDLRLDSLFVARYRETDDRENLKLFFEKGLAALEHTKLGIEKREFDSTFLFHWSLLTSCHGYVCAAIMARGDDMQNRRAGIAGGKATNLDAQRLWFSHVFLKLQKPKVKRETTDYNVVQLIQKIITNGTYPDTNFDQAWYRKILSDKGDGHFELTSGFQQRGLSVKEMKRLIEADEFNIPSIENLHDP